MKTPQTEPRVAGDDYRIAVKDFGPIAEADVEVRPLTVFIGPSNTGKSYLAILMYALHQCFGGSPDLFYRRDFPGRMRWYTSLAREAGRPKASIRKSLKDWLLKAASQEDSLPAPAFPTDVAAHLRSTLERAEGLGHFLEQEVRRCFGVDRLEELVRHPGSHVKASIDLRIPQQTGAEGIQYQLEFGRNNDVQCSGQIHDLDNEQFAFLLNRFRDRDDDEDRGPEFMLSRFTNRLFQSLLRPLCQDAYYLPADRTGVMHSHQVVVGTLVQNATTAGLRPSANIPMLSGVLADFLLELIQMSDLSERSRRSRPHGQTDHLEKTILKGVVRLERTETGYPHFAYRPEGWSDDLPLMRASSMVSELAPVVLYLRHLVRPGDMLIIEEPESHLHPAMQAVFAQELARIARSGIRVVVTTHSEWLLDQFANLVRLSELPEEKRTGFRGADCALRPEQFGAWQFEPKQRPRGSVVKELSIDPDAGGLASDYSEITELLYNEWARIGNRIEEERGR